MNDQHACHVMHRQTSALRIPQARVYSSNSSTTLATTLPVGATVAFFGLSWFAWGPDMRRGNPEESPLH
ncbi:MAG: hypothetical protein ACXV3D_02070 [Halobacteriota archaeon]